MNIYGTLPISEDKIRNSAKVILGFEDSDKAKSDVGQITTFNQLGFAGNNKKPDGWYLPYDFNQVAIILETKEYNPNHNFDKQDYEQIFSYVKIANQKYKQVIGILYNGAETVITKNNKIFRQDYQQLFKKEYYLNLFNPTSIDKQKIYSYTKSINDNLHFNFGINNLKHRMIFTACALVADKNGANLISIKNQNFNILKQVIIDKLELSYKEEKSKNDKLDIIKEQFELVNFNYVNNQQAINDFIDDVIAISGYIKSDSWNGEDVMGIFFNEFTRYKAKSEAGQVFTPDHITSLIYRIANVNYTDNVLDACCGSGAFLVKAMNNMINEVGGINNVDEVKKIHNERLFGIEFDKELFALACANMLIHKDGKTNLIHNDSRTPEACEWIKNKHITKVLMNPPFENKYGCLNIVANVLNNVEKGAICAFILPSNKLEVSRKIVTKWLKIHTLQKIIKLPNQLFSLAKGASDTSIFIFKAFEPQNNKDIFACYIDDDGLETVKNQGRQDTQNKWSNIEDYWVDVIYKQSGDNSCIWLNANEHLEYKIKQEVQQAEFSDFNKTVLDYLLFKNNIDKKEFETAILNTILYNETNATNQLNKIIQKLSNSNVNFITTDYKNIDFTEQEKSALLLFKNLKNNNEISWKSFALNDIFYISGSKTTAKSKLENFGKGNYPYITTQATNNGIAGYYDFFTENGNCLTIDSAVLGTCFYQQNNFSASDHVEVLRPKDFELNEKIALFFVCLLNNIANILEYSYGKKRSQKALKTETIQLPQTADGNIDFALMQNLISAIEKIIMQNLVQKLNINIQK